MEVIDSQSIKSRKTERVRQNCRLRLRKRPFEVAIWPLSHCKAASFATRFGLFRRATQPIREQERALLMEKQNKNKEETNTHDAYKSCRSMKKSWPASFLAWFFREKHRASQSASRGKNVVGFCSFFTFPLVCVRCFSQLFRVARMKKIIAAKGWFAAIIFVLRRIFAVQMGFSGRFVDITP